MGFLFSTIHSRAGCIIENGEHVCWVECIEHGEHGGNDDAQRKSALEELRAHGSAAEDDRELGTEIDGGGAAADNKGTVLKEALRKVLDLVESC